MSYLYKKPVPKPIPAPVNEIVVPSIPEKVDVIGSSQSSASLGHITEITYEEHLKNLEMMCKKDREFMKRVRFFCEEHKDDNFPDVDKKPFPQSVINEIIDDLKDE